MLRDVKTLLRIVWWGVEPDSLLKTFWEDAGHVTPLRGDDGTGRDGVTEMSVAMNTMQHCWYGDGSRDQSQLK